VVDQAKIGYDLAGQVLTITLKRPQRRNALNWRVFAELESAFLAVRVAMRRRAASASPVPTLRTVRVTMSAAKSRSGGNCCSSPEPRPSEAAAHPYTTHPRGSSRVACPVVAEVLVALAQQLADTLAVAAEA